MEMKCRLKNLLLQVRKTSEGLLKDFHSPQEWVHQVDPSANHALWFAGHMGTVDNFFLSVVAPDQVKEMGKNNELFGMGSKPTSNPEDYPSPEEVLSTMRERRETLLQVLDGFTDEDLAKSTPQGTPEMWPDYVSLFETAVWHESLHAGQVSIARKSLGNEPLLSAPSNQK